MKRREYGMGEAKRRQAKKCSSALERTIANLSKSGPMELKVIDLRDAMMFGPDVGDAAIILSALKQFAKLVDAGKKPTCLLCDAEWTGSGEEPPFMLAIVRTVEEFRCGSESTGMASGICHQCVNQPHDEFRERLLKTYREIWPDLETFDMASIREAPTTMQ